MNYKGVIIEESLTDNSVLDKVRVIKTRIEKVTDKHKTPWIEKWTLRTVEIPEREADNVAKLLSESIDVTHESSWYVDFKNNRNHYIVFRDKVFKIDILKPFQYKEARDFGIRMGIPEYQMEFERLKR